VRITCTVERGLATTALWFVRGVRRSEAFQRGRRTQAEKHFILQCYMYVKQRVEMFKRIKEKCQIEMNIERLEEGKQMNILIGEGGGKNGKEIRKIVIDYIRKANNIRKRYIAS